MMSTLLTICQDCLEGMPRPPNGGPLPCPGDLGVPADHIRDGFCPMGKYPSAGAGDTLAKVLRRLGVAHVFRRCRGCKRRRVRLNVLLPYKQTGAGPIRGG